MIITTTQKHSETSEILSCSLFDTQTGIKYSLSLNRNVKYAATVKVELYSAHSSTGENDYPGASYYHDEALDFWRELITVLPGVNETLSGDALYAAAKLISDNQFAEEIKAHKSGEKVLNSDIPF